MPYRDPEEARIANKKWRLANAEKNSERVKKWREKNKDRVRLKGREWREKNVSKVRGAHRRWCEANQATRKQQYRKHRLKRIFGITPEQYDAILVSQNYRCAACASDLQETSKKHRHLDHNHETGEFRGILCQSCNTALGLLKEDVERMYALAAYIERHDRDVNSAVNILRLGRSASPRVDESQLNTRACANV